MATASGCPPGVSVPLTPEVTLTFGSPLPHVLVTANAPAPSPRCDPGRPRATSSTSSSRLVRVRRLVDRQGYAPEEEEEPLLDDDDTLALFQAASLQDLHAVGPRAGSRVRPPAPAARSASSQPTAEGSKGTTSTLAWSSPRATARGLVGWRGTCCARRRSVRGSNGRTGAWCSRSSARGRTARPPFGSHPRSW